MLPAEIRVLKTICLDKKCQNVLYILPGEKVLECHKCGQKHNKASLHDIQEVRSDELKQAVKNSFLRLCFNNSMPKRGTEMVKVLGLSNYHCKLLSPLLTRYGMDKSSGRATLLTEMNRGDILDCSLFCDRAFLIDPDNISIYGFGKDITGSVDYLSETLKLIVAYNGSEERLIPIHADGDGHCLVHAISRALVGRELFWHPLRCCLKQHFETNIDKYKELFKDFIDTDEWPSIIEECDPDFQPPEGELHGLRNIHIFGLANVLRRPIILLDSLECMQKCGDYSALFLPGFVSPEMCKGKDNISLNKPLCIAWSSYSHNHYIPLVGIQNKPLPSLPAALIPKVWGMPQTQISLYMEFDGDGGCIVGGNKTLADAYLQRLVHAMEVLYYEKNGIHPLLVADAKFYLYPDSILFSAKPAMVLERTKTAVQEGRLYRCLLCGALCEVNRGANKWSSNNSAVSSQYLQNLKKIKDSNLDYILGYNSMKNDSIVRPELQSCTFCYSQILRKVTNDGTVIYKAEDKDNLDRNICMYEPGKRYYPDEHISNKPNKEDPKKSRIPLKLFWNGKKVEDEISYCDTLNNSKTNLNQFVKDVSKKIIAKHFSDNSSDVNLQAYITEEIWKVLEKNNLKRDIDLESKSEFRRQDSAKAMKLESPITFHSKPSEIQYIKVCSPDGQQAHYSLTDDGISYGQLQEWIKNEFKIPVKNQVIKRGVPPRLIKPSSDSKKQMLTDLKHGDRLVVEFKQRDDSPYSLKTHSPLKKVLPKSGIKYPSDTSWDTIKASPEHFRSSGFIYKLIEANYKLNNLLHATLDEYPEKVFCYNDMLNTIDLCVDSLGHFLISSNIEEEIEEFKHGLPVIGFNICPLSGELNGMNSSVAYLRTIASSHNQQICRQGPGFSSFRKSDMDFS